MNRSWILAAAAFLAATPLAAQQTSQRSERDFRWEGSVPSGRWLYLRNLNGAIRVERASGSRVEVTAEKRWRRGNPEDVRIETRRVGSGEQDVLICALWFDTSECDEEGYRTHNDRRDRDRDRNNDVSVDFVVRLPAGVKVDVSTVNGGLQVDGASSEVEAHTVNGRVVANSSGGPVNAGTVNGDIEVRMGSLGSGDLSFETVNGSIEVVVPDAALDADVDMRTVNGQVGSDFAMTVQGRINPRRIRATIGRGGRRIELRTINGSVELRKP